MNRSSADLLAALKEQPDDPELHSELLEAFADEGAGGSPDRFACILWMARHDPGNRWCVTPLAHVAPELAPEAFREIRAAWLDRAGSADVDATSLRGAALFVAAGNRNEALALLRRAALLAPRDPKVWLDIGRLSPSGADRLAAFLEAHRLDDKFEDVRAWIATTAAAERDLETATSFAEALLRDARALRSHHGEIPA